MIRQGIPHTPRGRTVEFHHRLRTASRASGPSPAASCRPPAAITLDALSYAAAALLLTRLPLASSMSNSARSPVRDTLADIAEGLRYIRDHPLIRPLTLLGIGNSFTEGAVVGLIVVTAVRTFSMAPDDQRIGLFWAAAALGALAAATALPRLQKAVPVGWITLGGLAANATFLACWAAAPGLATGLAALACWQSANAQVSLNGIVIRQQLTPEHLQGRVNTTARMIAWGGALVSLLAGLATPLRRAHLTENGRSPVGGGAAAGPATALSRAQQSRNSGD